MDEDAVIRGMDFVWQAVAALAFLALFAGYVLSHFDLGRLARSVSRDGGPKARTLAGLRNEYEAGAGRSGSEWVDCACCGCPAIDARLDLPECEVCGWDGDARALKEARRNFATYGRVHAPGHAAALGWAMPSEDERRTSRRIATRCAAANPDHQLSEAFWTELEERLADLRAARTHRPGAGAR